MMNLKYCFSLSLLRLRCIVLAFFCLFCATIRLQAQDSMAIFTLSDFQSLVRAHHPVMQQAQLLTRSATAEMQMARGGFDPKIYGDYEQKYFDTKTYYSIGEYGFKIPTWYGLEVKGGYATADGAFVSPENKLPKSGQAILGVSLPVLQGLRIDERRANYRKAEQTNGLNEADRRAIVNDLMLETQKVYWKWAYYQQQYQVFEQAYRIAQQRFSAIKTTYEQGDRMAMDTLESFIQVQDRSFQLNEAQLDLQEATLKLSNFLWGAEKQVLPLPTKRKAQSLDNPLANVADIERTAMVNNLAQTHPIIKSYAFKINQLDIEKQFKQEKLKPKLNLNYNLLGDGLAVSNVFTDNYKWGISFSSSTLFRAERGDVALAKIKIENVELLRQQKTLELQNKLRLAFNEIDNLQTQIRLYEQTLSNYQRLLALENTRFELGESSLFLINSREMKYIEAQVKLAKLKVEYQIARASVTWANGQLF
jgi:outer membrane protein TolC